ncbi:unnamed protein product, partial [Polarella glacialis]
VLKSTLESSGVFRAVKGWWRMDQLTALVISGSFIYLAGDSRFVAKVRTLEMSFAARAELFSSDEGELKALATDGTDLFVSSSLSGKARLIRLRCIDLQRRGSLAFDGLSADWRSDDGYSRALMLSG